MTKFLIPALLLLILTIGSIACNPGEIVITKWPGGEKQVTYKILRGDTAHLIDVFYCAYYPNGKVWKNGYFKNGVEEGDWHFYYQSGKIRSKGRFVQGQRKGDFTVYYESGEMEQEGFLASGRLGQDSPYIHHFNRDGSRKAAKEDFSKYLVEHPEKWTEAQKQEIWIDAYTEVVAVYDNPKGFSDCVVDLLQRRCNFRDIQPLTAKQRGNLLQTLADQQQECNSLLKKL
ncbi:MAG TPA: hypothetical protein VGD35_11110 [Chitinophaga sp.]